MALAADLEQLAVEPSGIERSEREPSAEMYIPCGTGPSMARAIAYERSACIRAKKAPRSRNGM